MKISGYMICYNEKELIEISVRNMLQFVDELVLVDGHSTDGTSEIIDCLAKEFPNTINLLPMRQSVTRDRSMYNRDYVDGFNEIERRNHAISHCSFDYILSKDVDELYHEDTDFHSIIQDGKMAYSHIQYEICSPDHYLPDVHIVAHHMSPRLFRNDSMFFRVAGGSSRDAKGIDCPLTHQGKMIPRHMDGIGRYHFWHYKLLCPWTHGKFNVENRRKLVLPKVPSEHSAMIQAIADIIKEDK